MHQTLTCVGISCMTNKGMTKGGGGTMGEVYIHPVLPCNDPRVII